MREFDLPLVVLMSVLIGELPILLVLLDSDQVLEPDFDLFFEQVLNIAGRKHEVALALGNHQISVLLSVPLICHCHSRCFESYLNQVFFHG
jgi:hypothetical protein